MREEGLKPPTLRELILLLHASLTASPQDENSQRVVKSFTRGVLENLHGPVLAFSGVLRTSKGIIVLDDTYSGGTLTPRQVYEDFFTKHRYAKALVTEGYTGASRKELLNALVGNEVAVLANDKAVFKHGIDISGIGCMEDFGQIKYAFVSLDPNLNIFLSPGDASRGLVFGCC